MIGEPSADQIFARLAGYTDLMRHLFEEIARTA